MYQVPKYSRLNYRSFEDLSNVIVKNIHRINFDVDLVVGIPRSGILPATFISLLIHKPFNTLTEFLNGIDPIGGVRTTNLNKDYKNILIVDDSINSGHAISEVKKSLSGISDLNFKFASIFATSDSFRKVDVFFEIVDNPRIFQWNLLNSWIYSNSCVDIDGVLCEDPTDEENDDSSNYHYFLINAKPKFIPPVPINILVTNRLEKYREETIYWLEKYGIKYNELFMSQHKSKVDRQRANDYSQFKAKIYLENKRKVILFIESSAHQAIQINRISKLPVFCVENMSMYDFFINQDKFNYLKSRYLKKVWKLFGVDGK